MESTETIVKQEIWHKNFNLDSKDNLDEVPAEEAVYGIFAIVDEQPVNCRVVAQAENLQRAIKELFENPQAGGIRIFMQGTWIQMLQYQLMPGSSEAERLLVAEEWVLKFKPDITKDAEYPGYYDDSI